MKKILLILAGAMACAGCVAGVLLFGANKTAEPSAEAVVASAEKTESRNSDNAPMQIGNSDADSEDAEEAAANEESAPEATETEMPNTLNAAEDKNDEAEPSEETVASKEDTKTEPKPEKETQPAAAAEESKDLEAEKNAEEEARRAEVEHIRHLEALKASQEALPGVFAGDPDKGDYPFAERCPQQKDAFVDHWGLYVCEDVSYAAWKVEQKYGYMPNWGGNGNANQWPANARAAGYKVTNTPKAGYVGISNAGPWGHAVWVEEVDGDRIHISQYNARNAATDWKAGEYSEQWVDSSVYTYIDFEQ